MRHGLSNRSINEVIEDKQGRLWVGTKNKIFRFLNHRFIEYPLSDSAQFALYKIVQLKSGDLWILTTAGTYRIEKDHWEKRPLLSGFENMICKEMIETDRGIYYNYRTSIILKDNNGDISHLWDHAEASRGMYFYLMQFFNDTMYISTYDGIYQAAGNNIFKKLFENRLYEKSWRFFY
jgi:ligand-binding sensor domain-containing protein